LRCRHAGHQKSFKTAWRLTLRRAGVRYFRIYDPRSTYATRLSAGGDLAFVLGTGDQVHIAIAALRDGRITRLVSSITAPAGAETLYYASNGIIWAQPVSGCEPRKVGEGYDVAAEPSGKPL
jgi:hypothetical protein